MGIDKTLNNTDENYWAIAIPKLIHVVLKLDEQMFMIQRCPLPFVPTPLWTREQPHGWSESKVLPQGT